MLENREFEIAFVGLKPGISVYEYELGEKFFDAENATDFTTCKADIKLNLAKHPTFLQLKFEIGGKAEITDPHDFALAFWKYFNNPVLRVKHGKNGRENILKNYRWETLVKYFHSNILTKI